MTIRPASSIRRNAAVAIWAATWPVAWLSPGWLPLWPGLVALITVFLLQRVLTGLLAGAACGVLLLQNGNPLTAFGAFFTEHLIPSVQSDWRVSVIVFTLLLGGFAALIEHGGGLRTLFQKLAGGAGHAARRVRCGVFGLGMVCFFDGLANSMLVGRSMRPMADRAGVSRAKLAYIVDSTSSAVACVAMVSTWIAYQLTMIEEGFRQAGRDEVNPYGLFLQSLPYNFYCWFTILLVSIVVWRDWNPGPMRAAEATARAAPLPDTGAPASVPDGSPARALVPLGVLIFGILGGMLWSGSGGNPDWSWEGISRAFGAADAAAVLVVAAAFACLTAFFLNRRDEPGSEGAADVFLNGVTSLFIPVLILISAWVLGSAQRELGAAAWLADMAGDHFPAALLPAAVFIAAMTVAFTTGTSWGTMGVLTPLAIPVALALGGAGEETALVAAVIAAVFGGAVFGDHCSPLSDTTIVSSISCGLEPMEHVRTQLPYALVAAAVSLLFGYLPVALGAPVWLALAAGVVILWFLPRWWKTGPAG